MATGELALVLHAHLPYVRSSQPGSLDEDWFFQALLESYLPLLELLEAAAAAPCPSSSRLVCPRRQCNQRNLTLRPGTGHKRKGMTSEGRFAGA